ncbi:MAG: succinate dehydrogenase/fumarate reductase iron-sulfur subunit [Proteobacteria bacterium]|nr:succinate dehydrogenase/fumarate reductase iron-sulfur subunit [Pseudomonadota bacterium]
MKIDLKIRRYNPSSKQGREPYYQAYSVNASEGMTVLEAMLEIVGTQDPTLSFRRSCRSSICGSCAVKVNGFTKLACSTQIIPEHQKTGEMVIEPIANHTVLKDLIVDFDPFWKKMDKVKPYLIPPESQTEEVAITQENAAAIDDAQKCIMCGSCNSECNALEIEKKYLGPAALAKAWRFVGDVREEGGRGRLGRLSDDHGIWDCVRCVHCVEYCPKGVEPLTAIERLRARALEENIRDNHGAKHVDAMVESVKKVGRLDEAAMTFKTLGLLRSLGMIPMGLKMEMHGKMPHPHLFPQIKKIGEVRAIYKEIEGRKKTSKKSRKVKRRKTD